jgi:L-glutamine-phosphate cytidylyltransferase
VHQGLFTKINNLIQASNEDELFNVAVQQLADEGVWVRFTSTGDLPWAEIDDPGDLAFERLYVFPRVSSRPITA